MKHYGDITKINGAEIPIVDIITGGSPCQDLSVAGLRKGLAGARSGLFMEQIRIVKEQRNECIRQLRMRGANVDLRFIRPRFMVWENVPGAFSSNKGEDFRCVLEEICRIADQTATVPMPEKGKWSNSGCIVGDGWSVAWRLHDAQFWGVPQRRKRISLVADFGSESAPEILFERESVSGDIEAGNGEGKSSPGTVGEGAVKAISFQERAGCEGGVKESSYSENEQEPCQHSTINPCSNTKVYGISSYESNSMKSKNPNSGIYEADTSRTLDLNGGNPACNQGGMICLQRRFSTVNVYENGITPTLEAGAGEGGNNVPICLEGNGSRNSHKGDGYKKSETMYTLNTVEQHAVAYSTQACGDRDKPSQSFMEETAYTIPANPMSDRGQAVCTYQKVTGTLNPGAHAGSYNGQDAYNDMLIVDDAQAYGQGSFGNYKEGFGTLKSSGGDLGGGQRDTSDTVGALCARDYKGVGSQYVDEGKCVVQRF